jgi:hypothetical protein
LTKEVDTEGFGDAGTTGEIITRNNIAFALNYITVVIFSEDELARSGGE